MPTEKTRQVVIEIESDLTDDELHNVVEAAMANPVILQREVVSIYRYDSISGCWYN